MAKAKRSTCPFQAAAEIMGGEEVLRRLAGPRQLFYVWRDQGVPWHVIGPRLLQLWQEAASGKQLHRLEAQQRRVQELLEEVQRASQGGQWITGLFLKHQRHAGPTIATGRKPRRES